jgi:Zn-dependent protease with chaperone function
MISPGITYKAELTDGMSAAVRPVLLRLSSDTLYILDEATGDTLAAWAFAGLKVDGLGGGVMHIEHRDAQDMMVASSDGDLRSALAAARVGMKDVTGGNRRLQRVGVYVAAIGVILTGIYLAIPFVSASIAKQVPLEVEEKLALRMDAILEKYACRTAASDEAIETLRRRLEAGAPAGSPRAEIGVLNLSVVNAFTLPGGRVLLTRGLLDKAESSDEVAGVLAHELAHVSERHVMTQIVRSSILSVGWATTVGDFSGLLVVDPSTVFHVATRSFSRDDEREADRGAIARLDAARISRKGLVDFFERMQRDHGDDLKWLSTHPPTAERRDTLLAGAPSSEMTPALDPDAFASLKAACADKGKPPSSFSLETFGGDD